MAKMLRQEKRGRVEMKADGQGNRILENEEEGESLPGSEKSPGPEVRMSLFSSTSLKKFQVFKVK